MKRKINLKEKESIIDECKNISSSASTNNILDFLQDNLIDHKVVKKRALTKREKKLKRLQVNKEWKNVLRKSWSDTDPNPRYSTYYKLQLSMNSIEWNDFEGSLRKELPVTIRLGHFGKIKSLIAKALLRECKNTTGRFFEINGNVIPKERTLYQPIHWLSSHTHCWQMIFDAKCLSKEVSLQRIHQYLLREVAVGHIVRQELVSMIPVFLLDIKSHHKVLDVCAAPGSKTEQVLCSLYDNCDNPTGFVIANDSDPKRIQRVKTRYNRCNCPNILLTCSRAQELPTILEYNSMDRIICDVPCSGDGTIRKVPHLWRLWKSRTALEFHSLQLDITLSAVKLLKVGGILVYSTCSLNPIEDEAVVAELLRLNPTLSLKSVSIEGLLYQKGLSNWHCTIDAFTAGEDEVSKTHSIKKLPKLLKSMHPPTLEEVGKMNLDRCLRILPHQQDTGGFFIAVLTLEDHLPQLLNHKIHSKPNIIPMKNLGYNPKLRNEGFQQKQFLNLSELQVQFFESWFTSDLVSKFRLLQLNGQEFELLYFSPELIDFISPELLDIIYSGGLRIGLLQQLNMQFDFKVNPDSIRCILDSLKPEWKLNTSIDDFIVFSSIGLTNEVETNMSSVTSIPIVSNGIEEVIDESLVSVTSVCSFDVHIFKDSIMLYQENSQILIDVNLTDIFTKALIHFFVLESTVNHLVLSIDNLITIKSNELSEKVESKRRLSKADRRNLKKQSNRIGIRDSNENNIVHEPTECLNDLNNQWTEEFILLFQVEELYDKDDYKIYRFKRITQNDKCKSYINLLQLL